MSVSPAGILINGASGVGKSTALQALASLLAARGIPHGLVDLDMLTLTWPRPTDDPFGFRLAMRTLAAVAGEYRADGAGLVVVGHVFTEPAHLAAARAAIAAPDAPVVRLRASRSVVERRLRDRHRVDAPWELAAFLDGHDALERTLGAAAVDDAVIDVDELDPTQTAEAVLAAAGIPA